MHIPGVGRRHSDLLVRLDASLGLLAGPGTDVRFRELARRDAALEEDVEFTVLAHSLVSCLINKKVYLKKDFFLKESVT